MSDSILTGTKKLLGIEEDYTVFDVDILTHINSVFSTLQQLGIGADETFMITGKEESWSAFIADDKKTNAVKTYMYLRVRLLFDPPVVPSLLASIEKQILELEWRLGVNKVYPSIYPEEEVVES